MGGYSTLPSGTIPTKPGGAGATSIPTSSQSSVPWWVSGAATLIGSILGIAGKNKARNEQTAEYQREQAALDAKAKGKAALVRGILNANGYGNAMTDDQIFQYVRQTLEKPNVAGGLTSDIGNTLLGFGKSSALGELGPTNKTPQIVGRTPASVLGGGTVPGDPTSGPAAPMTTHRDTENTADPVGASDFWDWWMKNHNGQGNG